MIELFFKLLIGHAFADFALQNDYVAKFKQRYHPTPPPTGQYIPPLLQYNPHWFWVLGAHALMHGGVVWIITGRVEFALTEVVAHAWIDFSKCEGKINYHVDQFLHVVCKVLYCL